MPYDKGKSKCKYCGHKSSDHHYDRDDQPRCKSNCDCEMTAESVVKLHNETE